MNTASDHIDVLIASCLVGEATPNEVVFVEERKNKNENNRRYFEHLKLIFEKAAGVINDYSFNIFGGYSLGVERVEIGGLFNLVRGDVNGAQFAGLFNAVGGKMDGVQFAGIFNANADTVRGSQFAGVMNINGRSSREFTVAGVLNLNLGDTRGAQCTLVLIFTLLKKCL
ncbi:MAG: hypothetical protein WD824_14990 [Cyclobacteriaceae bacterium]